MSLAVHFVSAANQWNFNGTASSTWDWINVALPGSISSEVFKDWKDNSFSGFFSDNFVSAQCCPLWSAVIKIKCINELRVTLAMCCGRQWENEGFEGNRWILLNATKRHSVRNTWAPGIGGLGEDLKWFKDLQVNAVINHARGSTAQSGTEFPYLKLQEGLGCCQDSPTTLGKWCRPTAEQQWRTDRRLACELQTGAFRA